jgi:hypothetical protein
MLCGSISLHTDKLRRVHHVPLVHAIYGSTPINFENFLMSTWDFLSEPIELFMFRKYAHAESKLLHESVLKEISRDAYGLEHGNSHHAYELIDDIPTNEHGEVSLEDYLDAASHHRSVLFGHVEELRTAMKHGISGDVFWVAAEKRRSELVPGKSIDEIICMTEEQIAALVIR